MLRTFFSYLFLNILFSPLYITSGFFEFMVLTGSPHSYGALEITGIYLGNLLPNLMLWIAIRIWGKKFRCDHRLSTLLLILAVLVIGYFLLFTPLRYDGMIEELLQ